jgi:large subunit ribosomal protein L4
MPKTTIAEKKVNAAKPAKPAKTGVTAGVFTTQGKEVEPMKLPPALFGVPYNKKLIALAVRVYLANQRSGSASTKTRGEVEGSTRKIYRQKGTGRARHGAIRAPIFVGGGITFGPKPRDYSLGFPKAMRKAALYSALSFSCKSGFLKIVEGVEKLELKTKAFALMLKNLECTKRTLYVVGKQSQGTVRATKNIEYVTTRVWSQLGAYDLVTHKHVVFTKDAMTECISQEK